MRWPISAAPTRMPSGAMTAPKASRPMLSQMRRRCSGSIGMASGCARKTLSELARELAVEGPRSAIATAPPIITNQVLIS